MTQSGEEDVRGAYTALSIHSLLNLPISLPECSPAYNTNPSTADAPATFLTNLGPWIQSCQTYEGGIAGAPSNEAHGAYAFCALACLCIMGPPHHTIPRFLDIPILTSWLSARQLAPEGGFAGRTNKLVDGCYSHWVGGCWSLIQAAAGARNNDGNRDGDLSEVRLRDLQGLWSRQGLIRYLLSCAQVKKGGLRDKPGMRPDGYHTNYGLAGLSAAMHYYSYPSPAHGDADSDRVGDSGEDVDQYAMRLGAAYDWKAVRMSELVGERALFEESDEVAFVHPVFVLPMDVVRRTKMRFGGAAGAAEEWVRA
ncbi:hypothetical protein LTR28_011086 [Elasticomyces elasticus]|nr:hypothetical protein LTR28_011086 [Elasticomyces elasticus]